MDAVAIASVDAWIIVVIKDQQRLVVVDLGLDLVDVLAEFPDVELVDRTHLKVHGQLDLVVIDAIRAAQVGDIGKICLADEHAPREFFNYFAQLFLHIVDSRQVVGHSFGDERLRIAEGVDDLASPRRASSTGFSSQ